MTQEGTEQVAATSSPLEDVAREQVLARLRDVTGVLSGDASVQWDEVHEVLADLVDRIAALDMTRSMEGVAEAGGAASCLRGVVLAGGAGQPVEEFLLIPFGEVVVERPCAGSSFVFTRAHADSAKRWFDGIGRKLAIDYEHQSFDRFNTRGDGLRPAAGWIGKLDVREDGLWAVEVAWTERAEELLRSGEYRYFSPVVFWTDEDHTDVAALGPVALTNDPAMRGIQSLAARRQLGSAEEEGDTAGESGCEQTRAGAESVVGTELDEARREIGLLKRKLSGQEADTFVERGMRLGKILDSTSMDWREDYLDDPERTEQRLARAPVLLPPGRVMALDRRGEVQGLNEAERTFRQHSELYRRWGIGPEDLAAYERAAAAGRVKYGGVGQ